MHIQSGPCRQDGRTALQGHIGENAATLLELNVSGRGGTQAGAGDLCRPACIASAQRRRAPQTVRQHIKTTHHSGVLMAQDVAVKHKAAD